MRKYNFISGLPRSGTTLLSAILKQNPRFTAGISDVIQGYATAIIDSTNTSVGIDTTITIEKPRTTSNVNNKRLTGDYGNYIYTTSHLGNWPIDNLATVDLHCVPNASINVTSTSSISNTKIPILPAFNNNFNLLSKNII
jgi:hypothetical protein